MWWRRRRNDEIRLDVQRVTEAVSGADVVILSTDRVLRPEDIERIKAAWDQAFTGFATLPKVIVVSGLAVTVVHDERGSDGSGDGIDDVPTA